ncbi:PD-(D/E)XK motif protein [Streptomyces sp. NRRL F-5630]|uniref:PD-(D/E)XK motif protein n=1 Tax=Streptomyces sp. NRRL F-5630 TaxID=1463864 RepID=UPI003EB99B8A
MTEARVSWTDVEHYLAHRLATSYRLSPTGAPLISYEVEDGRRLCLYVQLGATESPAKPTHEQVRVDEVRRAGLRMARLTTPLHGVERDFHDLLNAVAERMLVGGRSFERALVETLDAWEALLRRRRGLDARARTGLLGELATLGSVARELGWEEALRSWRGPFGEEHDFGLRDLDAEVKTTSSEEPRHTVHGLGQLTPTGSRPLWLVSLGVTRAGSGGVTLAQYVEHTRKRIQREAPGAGRRFEQALERTGWEEDHPDDERWRTRRASLALLVTPSFPHLGTDNLPTGMRGRIHDVRYDIDLSGLSSAQNAPAPLTDIRLP